MCPLWAAIKKSRKYLTRFPAPFPQLNSKELAEICSKIAFGFIVCVSEPLQILGVETLPLHKLDYTGGTGRHLRLLKAL